MTLENLERFAPDYSALYFICHGVIREDVKDVLASSQLVLANGECMSARKLLDLRLQAEVVFLDACQSGRFRPSGRTEINGFVRGFLLGGAKAIIAPMVHVPIAEAGDLAEVFFRSWLSGRTRAEALQDAQISLLSRPSRHWAPYTLFGDHS